MSSSDSIVDSPDVEVTVDDFGKKERQFQSSTRARRRWKLLKNMRMGVRRTSLTQPEAELLKALEKRTLGTGQECGEVCHISESRSKLRQSLIVHKPNLTGAESSFIQALVDSPDVDDAALENTLKVLSEKSIQTVEEESEEDREEEITSKNPCLMPAQTDGNKDLRMELWNTKHGSTRSLKSNSSKDHDMDKDEEPKKAAEKLTFSSFFNNLFGTSSATGISDSVDEERDSKEEVDRCENMSTVINFSILDTSENNEVDNPHVLTPPLMDSLRLDMPYVVQEDNFWLKYSLFRDGASIEAFLANTRSSSPCILAIETVDGEVFGAFTSSYWKHNGNNYYGSGESFLWRLRSSRQEPCDSMHEFAMRESDVEVFKWSGKNRNVQLSNPRRIIVGGGEPEEDLGKSASTVAETEAKENWAFGLALGKELIKGTSGACATYDSPSLTKLHNGGTFEILNLEVWTLTPVEDENQAEKLELGRQFVFSLVTQQPQKTMTTAAA